MLARIYTWVYHLTKVAFLRILGIPNGRLDRALKAQQKSSGLPHADQRGKTWASQQDKEGRCWLDHSRAEFRISWVTLNLRQYGVCALLYFHSKCLQKLKKAKAEGCWNLVTQLFFMCTDLSNCALTPIESSRLKIQPLHVYCSPEIANSE